MAQFSKPRRIAAHDEVIKVRMREEFNKLIRLSVRLTPAKQAKSKEEERGKDSFPKR